MKLSFLCPRHRAWVLEDLHRAEVFWQNWIDDAEFGEFDRSSGQVVAKLGAAWDIAYALLESQWPDSSTSIKRFGYSAALFYHILGLEQQELCNEVMQRTETKLLRLIELNNSKQLQHDAFVTLAALDVGRYEASTLSSQHSNQSLGAIRQVAH